MALSTIFYMAFQIRAVSRGVARFARVVILGLPHDFDPAPQRAARVF